MPEAIVPNTFPSIQPGQARVALVGEAPGADEIQQGKPFVGFAGQRLDALLSYPTVGIVRSQCYVGNIMQIRPPTRNKKQLGPLDKWTKSDEGDKEAYHLPALEAGLRRLTEDLDKFDPTLCILMGRTALWAAKDKASIDDWRGSFFISDKEGPFKGRKCLATFHPSRTLHNYSDTPLLKFDLEKARKEMHTRTYEPPRRFLDSFACFSELRYYLETIIHDETPVACDIEGGIDSVSCIGFATSPTEAFIVPFETLDRKHVWSLEQESVLWGLVAKIMADPHIPKTYQNGLYDRFVLQWSYNILNYGCKDDTLLAFWEWNPELPKDLGTQASILTDEPYYKGDIKSTDQLTFYEYCARDAAITYEINQKLQTLLTPEQQGHYRFNHDCLNFLLYSELHGIRYDADEAKRRLSSIESDIYQTQEQLDQIAHGLGATKRLPFDDGREVLLQAVQAICCHKKKQEVPKKAYEEDWPWVLSRLQNNDLPLSSEEKGRLAILTGTTLNMKSHRKFQDFLYRTCGLPTQWKLDPKTKEMRVTTNYEALLKLSKSHDHPALKVSLLMTLLLTRATMLSTPSYQGRMYCSYNLVGSETGRISSSKAMLWTGEDRVGANLMTVPDEWTVFSEDHPLRAGMRDMYLADEDCLLLKADLRASDGWSIGAEMAALGDKTMLDDLLFGIKPALVAAYILRFGKEAYYKVANSRELLKTAISVIQKDDWEYFTSKIGVWGISYLMGWKLLSDTVFIQSEGKVKLTPVQAKDFIAAVKVRYRVDRWHDSRQADINRQPYPYKLPTSIGFTRRFFNRKTEVLGEVLAHIPQVFTTWSTKKAAHRLWTDPENRTPEGGLRVKILHQVHDELLMQVREEEADWAEGKVKEWFTNPVMIAGQRILIPFEGTLTRNWAADEKGKVRSL